MRHKENMERTSADDTKTTKNDPNNWPWKAMSLLALALSIINQVQIRTEPGKRIQPCECPKPSTPPLRASLGLRGETGLPESTARRRPRGQDYHGYKHRAKCIVEQKAVKENCKKGTWRRPKCIRKIVHAQDVCFSNLKGEKGDVGYFKGFDCGDVAGLDLSENVLKRFVEEVINYTKRNGLTNVNRLFCGGPAAPIIRPTQHPPGNDGVPKPTVSKRGCCLWQAMTFEGLKSNSNWLYLNRNATYILRFHKKRFDSDKTMETISDSCFWKCGEEVRNASCPPNVKPTLGYWHKDTSSLLTTGVISPENRRYRVNVSLIAAPVSTNGRPASLNVTALSIQQGPHCSYNFSNRTFISPTRKHSVSEGVRLEWVEDNFYVEAGKHIRVEVGSDTKWKLNMSETTMEISTEIDCLKM